MKKRNLLSGNVKRISRSELRKIAGGNSGCSGCGSPFLDSGTGQCAFRSGGQICFGTVQGSRCCV
ncbi:hypothetical protein [Ascidiimonas aurantiaca]|uniref:hypothetical protein n=1 Tax=Ascidiimonas aurantiaca TaxID=1685432 RepID=UPI0030EE0493